MASENRELHFIVKADELDQPSAPLSRGLDAAPHLQSLAETLWASPYQFSFFQAIRLLERIFPDRTPVGKDQGPGSEVVRFRTQVSFNFPASQIHELRPIESPADGQTTDLKKQGHEMIVSFFGLTGPMGVLPYPYTELLIDQLRKKETALWSFFDLFNHRLLSLFYRAWEKYRFPVAFERGGQDEFTECLFDVVGLGPQSLRQRQIFPDLGVLFYGGLMAQRPHSAMALQQILTDFFKVRFTIHQFSGQWIKLEPSTLTRLGSANSDLGISTIAGSRVWDVQSKFQVQIGPLTLREFLTFLPIGPAFRPTIELTRLFVGLEFDFDIRLLLKPEEVPVTILTTRARRKPLLGWTSWLKTRAFSSDQSPSVQLAAPV